MQSRRGASESNLIRVRILLYAIHLTHSAFPLIREQRARVWCRSHWSASPTPISDRRRRRFLILLMFAQQMCIMHGSGGGDGHIGVRCFRLRCLFFPLYSAQAAPNRCHTICFIFIFCTRPAPCSAMTIQSPVSVSLLSE